jgi:circadian clock protein KaiC
MDSNRTVRQTETLQKMPTGIEGFDEITGGGLPRRRTTLIIGGPGCGKTIFALQTLVNGARQWDEPGIFVAFEEKSHQIIANAASFGWDLEILEKEDKLFFLDAHLSADDVPSGSFDLIGMLAGLKAKADEMGAKRIVFDSLDALLTLLNDPIVERQELYRLHEWLSQAGPTGIITGRIETHDPLLSLRYGFMQFMADCVILLDHHMEERVSLRELRVLKYRGSNFAENQLPLVISPTGIQVTNFGLQDSAVEAQTERLSTGIERLDTMLSGGFYRGSSVLVTGAPGTAKTTLSASFSQAACNRGEKTLYVSFDERDTEIVRNLASVNIRLKPHIESGVLKIYSERSEARSAEEHLMRIKALIREEKPRCLVIDPLTAMIKAGGRIAALGMSQDLVRSAKAEGITLFLTGIAEGTESQTENTEMGISAIADTWIHVSFMAQGGERNRALTIVKSRGTRHSNQVRELILSDQGVTLTDVYTTGGEVLMGSLRWGKMRLEAADKERTRATDERKRSELALSEVETLARMEALQRQLEAQRAELAFYTTQQMVQEEEWRLKQKDLGEIRDADKEV